MRFIKTESSNFIATLGEVVIGRFFTRGCIIRLDELSSVVRRSRRTMEDSSSRHIISLLPVFILETHNQTNNECLPKFVLTDNASASIKIAILCTFTSEAPIMLFDIIVSKNISNISMTTFHCRNLMQTL